MKQIMKAKFMCVYALVEGFGQLVVAVDTTVAFHTLTSVTAPFFQIGVTEDALVQAGFRCVRLHYDELRDIPEKITEEFFNKQADLVSKMENAGNN